MYIKFKKLAIFSLVILFLFSSFSLNVKSYESTDIDNLAFKQQIEIPIDTSLENAKFQPIDIRIDFTKSCWAKDENHHSVRVGFDDGSSLNELESQIYDLEFSDDTHISSCCVVFLIPENADGNEEYYVLYDSVETKAPEYEDHIMIEDTHYFYEPISGQKLDIDYYGIWDDKSVIFGVIQTGDLLGNPYSQGVIKCKPGSKLVETYNIDQLSSFDMRYGIVEEPAYVGTSWATSVKKTVLVEGNLMTRVRIEGFSPGDAIKTDNIYTYYHSPIEKRRIFIDIYHEVLKDIDVEEPSVLDGTYAGILTIKSRSGSIEKMNVGEILPKIYLYDEEDTINEFDVPQNPSTVERELILSTEDDIDLGEKAWISLSDPSTGKAHGLILNSNTGLSTEDDGVQVKSWVKENIKLPGLEAETGNLYVTRNSYESGGSHKENLKQGFKVNFKAVFMTVEENGYEVIDKESEIYQELIQIFPTMREGEIEEEEDVESYSLECFVHLAPSVPLGSLLSAATGKDIPYIYAELFKENNLKSSGSLSRLPIGSVELDLEGKSIFEKIKTIFGMFDFKNISLFKKIVFPDVEAGTYVIKIFRENRFFGKEREYIGYAVITVEEDTTIRIFCKSEAASTFTIKDQNENGIPDVKFQLLDNDAIIADGVTNEDGIIGLKAPIKTRNPYKLQVIYKGFLIEEKDVKLRRFNRFIAYSSCFSMDLLNLKLNVKDTWGFTPAVDLNPKITSSEMYEEKVIKSEKINYGEYEFNDLITADYVVKLRYKSFELEENINLYNDVTLQLSFPAEYTVSLDIKNSLGNKLEENGEVILSRFSKTNYATFDDKGKASFEVPPGKYKIELIVDDETVASQNIDVKGDKSLDIVTKKDSGLHNIMIILGALLIILSFVYILWKRKLYNGLKLIVIGLLIISIFSPWWILNGEEGGIETSTETLLNPPNIVTFTSSSEAIGGSVSALPEEFTMVLEILALILGVVILISLITIFTKDRFRKSTIALSILSIIFLILCIGLFYYAMSQLTEVGVGSFIGSGEVETTIPGMIDKEMISSNWGPGVGFYLGIIAVAVSIILIFYKKIEKRIIK